MSGMKVVLQRVKKASCKVNNKIVSQIGKGILIFLGIEKGDTIEKAKNLSHKCINLRIFEDKGKMNLSVKDINGELLVISQFTLCANCRKGLRPSFDTAEQPQYALPLYKKFIEFIAEEGIQPKEGVFGEKMFVSLINDGPATFILSE